MSLRIGRLSTSENGYQKVTFNGRVVVASGVEQEDELFDGRVLGELYHRLQVIPLEVAPLRDRPEDIMPVLRHWLSVLGTDTPSFDVDAVAALTSHDWPGNVRELVNLARRLALFGDEGRIGADLVLRMLETNPFAPTRTESTTTETDVVEEISLEELERRHIEALMAHHRNISPGFPDPGHQPKNPPTQAHCWGHDYQPLNGS